MVLQYCDCHCSVERRFYMIIKLFAELLVPLVGGVECIFLLCFRYAIYIISFGPLCKLVHPCKECKMFNQCIKKVFLQSNLLKRYLFCTVPSHTGIWDSTQGKKCEKSRKLKSLKFRKVKKTKTKKTIAIVKNEQKRL